MGRVVEIGEYFIGHGCPVFIIAEAGVNHNGDLDRALSMIDAAVAAGVDAVKFQTYSTEALITRTAPKAQYQSLTTDPGESQFEMLKRLEISEEFQRQLVKHCRQRGIMFLSTPYDEGSADLLQELGVPAFKVASTDTTNIPFLKLLARKGRPVILSTGMSTLGEVEEAVFAIQGEGNPDVIILQCTAQYPSPISEMNLNAMATMRQAFGCPVGFSDHSEGIGAAPWAVAAGACMVEKHFTLSRNLPGPDHLASLEPGELTDLVRIVRQVEQAMGDGIKRPVPCELPNKLTHQKSIVARRHIAAGQVLVAEDLTCKRPGTGVRPRYLEQFIGLRARRDIAADELLDWTLFERCG